MVFSHILFKMRDGITKIIQSFEDHSKHASDKDIIKPLNERLELEDVEVAATEESNQTSDIHLDPIELHHIQLSKKQKRKSYKGKLNFLIKVAVIIDLLKSLINQ